MLAVPTDRLPAAVGDLDPGNRALLDLSLRRGVSDAEIGELLRKDPADVARGRDAVLELLADALDVAGHDRRERVREAISSLSDDDWRGAPPAPGLSQPEEPGEPGPPQEPEPREAPGPLFPRDRDDELYFEPERPRSRRGGLLLVVALLAILGAILALILGGGDDDEPADESRSQPAPQQGGPADGDSVRLAPIGGDRGKGQVTVTDEGATITISGLPKPDGAYQVWLYDSVVQAKSLGTITEGSGELEVQLPSDARSYPFLDVSLEPPDQNPNHSGDSVLRAPLRDVLSQ